MTPALLDLAGCDPARDLDQDTQAHDALVPPQHLRVHVDGGVAAVGPAEPVPQPLARSTDHRTEHTGHGHGRLGEDEPGEGQVVGLTTSLGATVAAGQQMLWSGDTGRSGAPHLHLEIRVDGDQRCPQPLLAGLYTNAVGIEPAALPPSGCSF